MPASLTTSWNHRVLPDASHWILQSPLFSLSHRVVWVPVLLAFLVLSLPDSLARLFRGSPSLNIGVVWGLGTSHAVSLGNSIPPVRLRGLSVLVILSATSSPASTWAADQHSQLSPRHLYLDSHKLLPSAHSHSYDLSPKAHASFLSEWHHHLSSFLLLSWLGIYIKVN